MWGVRKRRKILTEEKQCEVQVWQLLNFVLGVLKFFKWKCLVIDCRGTRIWKARDLTRLRFISLSFAKREMIEVMGEVRLFRKNR